MCSTTTNKISKALVKYDLFQVVAKVYENNQKLTKKKTVNR
jgi:hypothetical protein